MSPGRQAYERARAECRMDRTWEDLGDNERDAWERGALMAPVTGVLKLTQAADRKVP